MAKTRLAPIGWKKGPFLTVRPASKKKRPKRKLGATKARVKIKTPAPVGGYAGRGAALQGLGFDSYPAYLQSDLWKSIRLKALSRDGHCCRACQRPANEVHHQSYAEEVLRGDDLAKLWTLCRDCHEYIEVVDGKKLKRMGAVQHRLNALIALHRRNRT